MVDMIQDRLEASVFMSYYNQLGKKSLKELGAKVLAILAQESASLEET
jgi:hypothetical protein